MKPMTAQTLYRTPQESNRRPDGSHSVAQSAHRFGLLAALAAAVVLATLLAGAGTEPAAASHLKQKCFPSGSKTVYKTSEGRFYTRTVKPYFGGTKALFACSYRYGRSYRLWQGDYSEPDSSYKLFRISGHFAGYVVDPGCPADDGCGVGRRVTSLNLRTGVDRAYEGTSHHVGLEDVHDLVLRRNGSIASIATGTEPGDEAPSVTQVRALDAGGVRTLDEGPTISLRSLELDGTTVSWVNDGVRKSATLR